MAGYIEIRPDGLQRCNNNMREICRKYVYVRVKITTYLISNSSIYQEDVSEVSLKYDNSDNVYNR